MNILVTGGSSGLGRAIVEKLASDSNNTVYFTYNKSVDSANRLTNAYANVIGRQCDFLSQPSIENLLSDMPCWDLDVLINNAYSGNPQGNHFHKIDANDFMDSFRINVLPVIMITQSALAIFRKKKSGKIITILTSALLNLPPIGYSLYAANKAYIEQLAKSWSKEYVKFGITSNCISPNFMQTELTKDTDERIVEQMISEHPFKKLLTTEEVAECVSFLTLASAQINGVNIPLNAGVNVI